ncbi:hypothetical protein [Saccharopolyspora hattusasensis]|uniref:hypothetical protein n=1 Tax=Saccharopolyspora hattusasensis TaxID=1128679 RepID=UPI003D987E4D
MTNTKPLRFRRLAAGMYRATNTGGTLRYELERLRPGTWHLRIYNLSNLIIPVGLRDMSAQASKADAVAAANAYERIHDGYKAAKYGNYSLMSAASFIAKGLMSEEGDTK